MNNCRQPLALGLERGVRPCPTKTPNAIGKTMKQAHSAATIATRVTAKNRVSAAVTSAVRTGLAWTTTSLVQKRDATAKVGLAWPNV